MPWTPLVWTTVGSLAVPLWATWPALSLQTREIPALECLTIVFLVAWAVTSPLEKAARPMDLLPSTWRWWIPAMAFGLAEVERDCGEGGRDLGARSTGLARASDVRTWLTART
jgi:hypothetical protein